MKEAIMLKRSELREKRSKLSNKSCDYWIKSQYLEKRGQSWEIIKSSDYGLKVKIWRKKIKIERQEVRSVSLKG